MSVIIAYEYVLLVLNAPEIVCRHKVCAWAHTIYSFYRILEC